MTVFGFDGRGHGARMVARAPVIPGRPAAPGPGPAVGPCVACGYGDRNGVLRHGAVVDGVRLLLCVDWRACCARWRGVSR